MVSHLRHGKLTLLAGLYVATLALPALASDWPQFRGVNGSGVSADTTPLPTEWSESKNLQWKLELPGPGHSCPIVIEDRVFITCWSGYGVTRSELGKQEDLKRHLICVNRKTGKVIWDRSVPAILPEDTYQGMFAEHGYASHTPVSDGTHVFAFFGKSGVYAFDMAGNELWHKDVGSNRDARGWGTASSLVLYKDKVIVTASIESRTVFAFDKQTGKEIWRQQADGLGSTWGTPVLVNLPDGGTDLVLAVPFEIWGLNPENGKLRWFCEGADSDSYCSSAITHDGIVYVIEARGGGGAMAIRAGGKGDVTKTNILWSTNDRGRISTPVYFEGKLYFVSGKIIKCLDAKTGDRIYQARLTSSGNSSQTNSDEASASGEGRRGGFGRGGRGGGMGGQDYSSPVVSGNKMYYVARSGELFVIELGNEFKQLAANRFESDDTDFSASPAISDGQLFIRSNKALYCVSEQG